MTELTEHNAKLIAVSKTKPASDIMELYQQGQRIFGENRAQELAEKARILPADIEWHMIGHLQSKKVKTIADVVQMIHSVDSVRLLHEIEKQAHKCDRTIQALIQIKIAREESKFGLQTKEEIKTFFAQIQTMEWNHVEVTGVMGMATFTNDLTQISSEFKQLKTYYDHIKEDYYPTDDRFKEISMGMSADYQLALASGSTMVRIGSLLFGARDYA